MLSAPIDLKTVRELFADPVRLAGSDFLRREIADRMREKLALVKIEPHHILDAGCGEGVDMQHLQHSFAKAAVFGVDISQQLLSNAQQLEKNAQNKFERVLGKLFPSAMRKNPENQFVCGDFARLPLKHGSFDMVWSNLALHWHPQPDLVFAEWRRVLRTDGLLMFSCFGPDTLIQLRQAFEGIDTYPHTLPFVDMHDFGDMLVNAGFSTPVMDMEKITLTYATLEQLFTDVRALGGNPLLSRRRGLFGKQAYRTVCERLEAMRQVDGRIALSFEIVYGHAFRPVTQKTAQGESIIRMQPKPR